MRPIKEDNLLHEQVLAITRGKGLQLKEEEVTFEVYLKCGFRTSRPILWAAALEELISDYRWDYTMQDDKYIQCWIKLTNAGGMINIEIKLNTGIILVYGSQYDDWIKSFFDKWKSLAVDGVRPLTEPGSDQPQDSEGAPPMKSDTQIDMERLWQEHKTLKTAFTT